MTLPAGAYAALTADAVARCHARAARIVLNGPLDPARALACGAGGMHLGSLALAALETRPPAADHLLSVACHSREHVLQAARIGADCAARSPVLPTLTHPGAPTLGWERFAACAADAACRSTRSAA